MVAQVSDAHAHNTPQHPAGPHRADVTNERARNRKALALLWTRKYVHWILELLDCIGHEIEFHQKPINYVGQPKRHRVCIAASVPDPNLLDL